MIRIVAGGLSGVCLAGALASFVAPRPGSGAEPAGKPGSVGSLSQQVGDPTPLHPVSVTRPDSPPRVTVGPDSRGRVLEVACGTCHSPQPIDASIRRPPRGFHQGLSYEHGALACAACHDAADADRLHLADGSALDFADVDRLCSQCHGTQRRDWEHGAHGGMRGFWDLRRGPRQRSGCTDCHDPHAPAFPRMRVQFRPRDRFLEPGVPDHE